MNNLKLFMAYVYSLIFHETDFHTGFQWCSWICESRTKKNIHQGLGSQLIFLETDETDVGILTDYFYKKKNNKINIYISIDILVKPAAVHIEVQFCPDRTFPVLAADIHGRLISQRKSILNFLWKWNPFPVRLSTDDYLGSWTKFRVFPLSIFFFIAMFKFDN